MNKLILCEGKTDAILLSYYLENTCGWMHRKVLKGLEIKADERRNESAYWYAKGEDNLLICGVGGKDNFCDFFSTENPASHDNQQCIFQNCGGDRPR